MRRLLIIIGSLVALVVVVAVLALLFIDVDKYRPRIQAELQAKLGRQVTLGHLHLHILPLSIRVDGLTIAEAPSFSSGRPFATAQNVSVSAGLLSLIRGNPDIKSVLLDRPQVELIRNASGVWNFSTLGAQNSPAAGSNKPPSTFTLDTLKIADGQLGITDQMTHEPRSVYDYIDLELSDFRPNTPFGVDLGVHFPGTGKELLSFKGNVGPLQPGNVAATPMNGKLSLQEVSLAAVNRFAAGTLPANTDAIASADADVKSQAAVLSCNGTLKLDNAVIHGAKLDYPIQAKYNLSADRKQDKIAIQSGTISLGPTTFTASGDIDARAKPANLNLHLSTTNSSVTELARLAGAFGVGINPAYRVDGRLTANIIAKGPATDPQFDGSIDVTALKASAGSTTITGNVSARNLSAPQVQFALAADKIDTAELQQMTAKTQNAAPASSKPAAPSNQPSLFDKTTGSGTISAKTIKAQDFVLNNLQATCKLDHGVIQLSPLTADIFGGKENGAVSVDTRPANSLVSVNAKLAGADTNALLSAVSSMKNTLYGSLAADANVNFVLASSTDLARTLNGTLGFDVTNGQLKNVNILNELSKIGKFVGAAPTQPGNATALKKFSGTLNIRNGVATTNNLVAMLDAGSLSASGSLNLVNQALDMHMNAVLASGVSNAVGAAKIGGYLSTALANNKGELVLPVLVTGTTSHPVFAPDVQALAKMKLHNLLPSTGNPSELTNGIIGAAAGGKGAGGILNGIFGGASGQQPSSQQGPQGQKKSQQEQNPVNSILNQLGKKKPKQ